MKKLINYIFMLYIFMFFGIFDVNANTIKNIDMDVYIDKNGNANITEIWDVNLYNGTEGYRTFSNLGNSSIYNFTVEDDTGRVYESLNNWNVNSSFEQKAYKNGINKNKDNIELCWGISNYGNRKYTLKYNISDLVTQYKDTQGIYFNFLNLDQNVRNVNITIYSDIPFSVKNSKIWAFGYEGTVNFSDGKIVLTPKYSLEKNEYMVGLVKFESNLFNTNNNSNKSFDSVYKSAMIGVTINSFDYDFSIEDLILIIFFVIVIILIVIICSSPSITKGKKHN